MLSSNFTLRLSRSHVLSSSKPLQKMTNLSSIQLHKLTTQTIILRSTPQSNNTLLTLNLQRRKGERTLNKTKSLPQGKRTRAPQRTGTSTAKQTPTRTRSQAPAHQFSCRDRPRNSGTTAATNSASPAPAGREEAGEHDGDDLGLRSLCSP
jgi:hypothetical protein